MKRNPHERIRAGARIVGIGFEYQNGFSAFGQVKFSNISSKLNPSFGQEATLRANYSFPTSLTTLAKQSYDGKQKF